MVLKSEGWLSSSVKGDSRNDPSTVLPLTDYPTCCSPASVSLPDLFEYNAAVKHLPACSLMYHHVLKWKWKESERNKE